MNKIRSFVQCFITVATAILIIAAISYQSHPENLTPDTLWQILLSAGLCALATALFFPEEDASKLRIRVGLVLHFISLCVIMILCGRWFGWVGPGFLDAAIMVVDVIIVYAFTTGITYFISRQEAAQMNEQLKKKFARDNNEDPA